MDAEDYIEDKTTAIVRSICDKLAPTCVGCPMAKVFVSQDPNPERDDHRLKINLRCDKMGMIGNICPDRGDPSRKYAKDIGMRRLLSEEQLSNTTNLDRFGMAGRNNTDIGRILGGEFYLNLVRSKMKEQYRRTEAKLHIFNEAVSYVAQGRSVNIEPVFWIGEESHDSLSEAVVEVEVKHRLEYEQKVEFSTGICEPTTYMKEHLQKELQRPFGVFVEHAKLHEGIDFLGEELPPKPIVHVPEPTQDELYADWGAYG